MILNFTFKDTQITFNDDTISVILHAKIVYGHYGKVKVNVDLYSALSWSHL